MLTRKGTITTIPVIVSMIICTESCTTNQEVQMSRPYTYNNVNNPHEEIRKIEKTVRDHIGWAVNNKNKAQAFSTIAENDELFFFQPDSKGTIDGIKACRELMDNFFMQDDFKAIRTEINSLRIHVSPSLKTAWFACILNDYNEYQGKPANWENVRWTGVLEKIDNQWKIFQMHFSKAEDLVKQELTEGATTNSFKEGS